MYILRDQRISPGSNSVLARAVSRHEELKSKEPNQKNSELNIGVELGLHTV